MPKSVLQEAGLNVGDEVRVSVRKGRIVVAPAARVREKYDLKTLLSGMPDGYGPEEQNWGPQAGKRNLVGVRLCSGQGRLRDRDPGSAGRTRTEGTPPGPVVSNTLFTPYRTRHGLPADRRNVPFHVADPASSSLTGYIMVEQIKSIDYGRRQVKFVEKAPGFVVDDALAILDACLY